MRYQSTSTPLNQQRQTLPMSGKPLQDGSVFEILAITAGDGNGWTFTPEVLQSAVPLFSQTQCFIDHIEPDAGGRFKAFAAA